MMTLTIELSPDEEALLREQARRRGQAVEDEARSLVRAGLRPDPTVAGSEEAHMAFLRRLLEQGIIASIPEGRLGPPPRPISVRGEPVSKTIIEERG